MRTMHAVKIDAFGGPEALHLEEIPVPEPGEGEILVRVRAAGFNPVDYKIREGKYPAVKADKLPYTMGRDVSGDVEACGAGVTAFAEHEALYGTPGIDRGGYTVGYRGS